MRATLRVRIATPLSIGWHDPNILDRRFYIRPTSVKGVWRWWARAFVGGVLYERGCIRAERHRHVYLTPDKVSAEKIAKIVGLNLGLGYAGTKKAAASKFKITLKTIKPPSTDKARYRQGYIHHHGRFLSLHRFRLLTLSSDVEYATGGEFEINIDAPGVDKDVFQATAGILVVALTLSGLGKGSRKGLGCLDVIRTYGDLRPGPPENLLNDVRSALERLIKDDCGGQPDDLPPLPVVSKAKIHGIDITTVYKISDISFDNLHNFFLRPHRAKVLTGDYAKPDPLRQNLNAWILGLPREQNKQGYIMPDLDRRASTLMTCYHTSHLASQPAGYLTALVSGDWPTSLTWVGAGTQNITIDTQRILAAYRDALDEFKDYIAKLGGSLTRIWP